MLAASPRFFVRNLLKSFQSQPEVSERVGFHIYPTTFYSPIPLMEEIDAAKLAKPRFLPGVDLRVPEALKLIEELIPFSQELQDIPYEPDGKSSYWFKNDTFTDFDAAVLYGMLRLIKPKRYIEVGCGFSSLISSRGLRRNQEEGCACEATYADPYPRVDLEGKLAYGRLIKERVQNLPLSLFSELHAGDVLFIDTSHVLKLQSDVEHELLRILPSLAPGVWIHIHDIYTPYDYKSEWIFRPLRLSANEQYAVECLLSGGNRYQVEIPLHLLVRENKEAMLRLFARGNDIGQSLWLRKM